MLRCISAEMQKMKRTFTLKLLWIAPLVPLFCVYGSGQISGMYFWYCAFLPGALTIMCSMVMLKDKKMKYHSIFSLPMDKGKIWMGLFIAKSIAEQHGGAISIANSEVTGGGKVTIKIPVN